jgi:hypothetical protein
LGERKRKFSYASKFHLSNPEYSIDLLATSGLSHTCTHKYLWFLSSSVRKRSKIADLAKIGETTDVFWLIFVVGLVVIGVFALAATGALGELKSDDSFETNASFEEGQRIPLTLFGYQKTRVDRVISDLEAEIAVLKSKKN